MILLLFMQTLVHGQEKNDIAITYSQITLPQTAYVLGGVLGVAFTAGHFAFDNTKFIGAFSASYTRHVNNWFGYGGLMAIDHMTSDTYTMNDGEKVYNGKYDLTFLSLMPTATFYWFNHPHLSMYSKLGFGLGFVPDDVGFSAQLSPVGMDVGGETLRARIEMGYGMTGAITVGVSKWF